MGLFILTACVGSITVPTIVSNPNTQSFCEANPFRHSCNQEASENARQKIIAECEAGQDSNLCGDATAYSCYLNPKNPQCDTVVKDFCEANPFRQQCIQNEFESAREKIITECTTDDSGNLCGEATGYSCYVNPNGVLCERSAAKDGLQEDTVNTNTNNEIASLKDDLQKANNAKTTADNDITRLKNELATAIGERDSATGDKNTANLRITELEGELSTAEGERDTAKSRITTLEGELQTAEGERDTANLRITTLQGELSTAISERDSATGDKNTANLRITELEGELSTAISERDSATGDKNTANLRITELEGELSTAISERDSATGDKNTANLRITELEGELSTAISERDSATGDKNTANLRITELEGELSTAEGERDTANLRITELEGELSTAEGERDTANLRITELEGELSTAEGERDTANLRITELEGELSTAEGERDTANLRITELEGELSTAEGERDTANLRITTLEDEATQAGIAKMTADAEIARLNTLIRPTYNNWVRSVNPDASADLANPRNQFLQGKNGTLDTTGVTLCRDSSSAVGCDVAGSRRAPSVRNTNLQASRFDGQRINGDRNDGWAHLFGYIGETSYQYAGILDSTDLGAPLTGDAGTSVQWNGLFHGSLDFTLTITFDAVGGRLDAFIRRPHIGVGNLYYRLQNARFDTNGLITGTVNYQNFTDSDPTKPTGRAEDSVLSGLIGQEGVVAVFAGADAGGFIAGPDIAFNPDVRASDWTRKVGDIGAEFTSVPRNQFLSHPTPKNVRPNPVNSDGNVVFVGNIGPVVASGLGFRTKAIYSENPLGGNASGNIQYFAGYIGDTVYQYAGINPNVRTDLGAALPVWQAGQPTSAMWHGQFEVIEGAGDFTLKVNFENRRLTAAFFKSHPVDFYYELDAGFNADDNGFFVGTANRTLRSTNTITPGVLTGIIGEDGALGVFVSGTSNDNGQTITGGTGENSFRGGFVARPRLDDDPTKVTYTDWVAATNLDATADLTDQRGQILQSKNGTLDTTGLTRCSDRDSASYCGAVGSRTAPTVTKYNLNNSRFDGRRINGDGNGGYAYFQGYIGETGYRYAGILDSTDLGAPLTGDAGTSVQWNGVLNGPSGSFDFVLTITFDANGGRLDAFINSYANRFYRLQNARFDTGGVITGTVNLQRFTDSDPTQPIDTATDGDGNTGDSVLSGLIGEEGVVAVYVGTRIGVGTRTGGFIAGPDIAFNPDVRASDWTRNIGDFGAEFTSVPRNQFLYIVTDVRGVSTNSDGSGRVTPESLNLSTATFNGNPLGGGSGDIRFFSGYNGGTRHYYAGISNFANLGATLPVWQTGQPTSAEWKGAFGVLQGANAIVKKDLTLEVNFENRRLTAFVPVGTNHYLLDAGFNADDDGFFAGTVNFGAFTDTTSRTSTNTLTPGVLTGIIGTRGAVGVFVSGSSVDNGQTITGGEGENGFTGGFVACPYDETGNRCQQ